MEVRHPDFVDFLPGLFPGKIHGPGKRTVLHQCAGRTRIHHRGDATIRARSQGAAAATLGPGAFYWTSLLGGLVDVSTVIAPAAEMLRTQTISLPTAEIAVLLALVANAVQKIMVAVTSGTREYALRVTAVFALWF